MKLAPFERKCLWCVALNERRKSSPRLAFCDDMTRKNHTKIHILVQLSISTFFGFFDFMTCRV